ncbi:MAG: phosphoglycerate dehydrogenase [Bryobacterales bacterium]|nr:phosphoglycerate dehydrogenase [Bryobacterales bacterium]
MKVLVAEPLSPAAIELMKAQSDWDVVFSNPKEYAAHLAGAEALVVRSAVKVTGEVLRQAPRLRVIGRAGVGVDNVDLKAATAAGVLVMNTPGGNAVSVAEHTLALMLGLARSIPQASLSTKSGKWEKKKFLGSELRGKTLGIIGLGSIGREVVLRARAFEMRIVASDPFVTSDTAANLGVELVDLDTLYASSDYISLHMALTPDTRDLISTGALDKMKPGVRIVNCARGELIDTEALREALESGRVAGAGLDVFNPEPLPAGHPLLQVDSLIATPHIAGSTEEAQEIVGIRIVEQMITYLRDGIAINAVNVPAVSPEQYRTLGPYIILTERLGNFAANIATGNPKGVRLTYSGHIAEMNTQLIRNAGLAGVLNRSLSQKANIVNALQIASERGLATAESHLTRSAAMDSVRLELETDHGVVAVEGAVVLGKPRLLHVNGIYCEAPLSGHLAYLRNRDVPGVIGHVGMVLGRNSINIANFSLGRQNGPARPGEVLEAVALVETDGEVPDGVLAQLRQNPAVLIARSVEFSS